jgi:DUF1016 N-terminal domain
MRAFAAAFPAEITQRPVARLPWEHVTVLLDNLNDQNEREWYGTAAAEYGWSRNVLLNQIMNQLHTPAAAAPSNLPDQLPAADWGSAAGSTASPTPAASTAGVAGSAPSTTRTHTRSQLRATRPQHDGPAYTLAGG